MTEDQIKNSQIIAKFALKPTPSILDNSNIYKYLTDKTLVTEMQFHSSWDWLIPVWVKVWRHLCKDKQLNGSTLEQLKQNLKHHEHFSNLVCNDLIDKAFIFIVERIHFDLDQ